MAKRSREEVVDLVRRQRPGVVCGGRRLVPVESAAHREQIVHGDRRLRPAGDGDRWPEERVESFGRSTQDALGGRDPREQGQHALRARPDVRGRVPRRATEVALVDERPVAHDHETADIPEVGRPRFGGRQGGLIDAGHRRREGRPGSGQVGGA